MRWKIEIRPKAAKQFRKLDVKAQKIILKYLKERLQCAEEPRSLGVRLKNTDDFWRFRVGDYRLICRIFDETITIEVLKVGHRRDVYDRLT